MQCARCGSNRVKQVGKRPTGRTTVDARLHTLYECEVYYQCARCQHYWSFVGWYVNWW